jgi:hypothetical protein
VDLRNFEQISLMLTSILRNLGKGDTLAKRRGTFACLGTQVQEIDPKLTAREKIEDER